MGNKGIRKLTELLRTSDSIMRNLRYLNLERNNIDTPKMLELYNHYYKSCLKPASCMKYINIQGNNVLNKDRLELKVMRKRKKHGDRCVLVMEKPYVEVNFKQHDHTKIKGEKRIRF